MRPGVRVTGGMEFGDGMAQSMQEKKCSWTAEKITTEVQQRNAGDYAWETAIGDGVISGHLAFLLSLEMLAGCLRKDQDCQ